MGCVTFGREIDQTAAFAMMDHAIEHGIKAFDTAAAYGGGNSEAIVGAWLAAHPEHRSRVSLETKLLPPYTADRLRAGVAASLARLKQETIDLLYLHQWHASALDPEVSRELDALVRVGRVRAIGASNFTGAQVGQLLALQTSLGCTPVRAVQNVHNYAVQGFDPSLRALTESHSLTLVGYSPLGAGFLTGKYRERVEPGSRFGLVPGHQRIYFTDAGWARLARLEAIAARANVSTAHLALAWALHDPQVNTVLIGGRSLEQIDQARAAQRYDNAAILADLSGS